MASPGVLDPFGETIEGLDTASAALFQPDWVYPRDSTVEVVSGPTYASIYLKNKDGLYEKIEVNAYQTRDAAWWFSAHDALESTLSTAQDILSDPRYLDVKAERRLDRDNQRTMTPEQYQLWREARDREVAAWEAVQEAARAVVAALSDGDAADVLTLVGEVLDGEKGAVERLTEKLKEIQAEDAKAGKGAKSFIERLQELIDKLKQAIDEYEEAAVFAQMCQMLGFLPCTDAAEEWCEGEGGQDWCHQEQICAPEDKCNCILKVEGKNGAPSTEWNPGVYVPSVGGRGADSTGDEESRSPPDGKSDAPDAASPASRDVRPEGTPDSGAGTSSGGGAAGGVAPVRPPVSPPSSGGAAGGPTGGGGVSPHRGDVSSAIHAASVTKKGPSTVTPPGTDTLGPTTTRGPGTTSAAPDGVSGPTSTIVEPRSSRGPCVTCEEAWRRGLEEVSEESVNCLWEAALRTVGADRRPLSDGIPRNGTLAERHRALMEACGLHLSANPKDPYAGPGNENLPVWPEASSEPVGPTSGVPDERRRTHLRTVGNWLRENRSSDCLSMLNERLQRFEDHRSRAENLSLLYQALLHNAPAGYWSVERAAEALGMIQDYTPLGQRGSGYWAGLAWELEDRIRLLCGNLPSPRSVADLPSDPEEAAGAAGPGSPADATSKADCCKVISRRPLGLAAGVTRTVFGGIASAAGLFGGTAVHYFDDLSDEELAENLLEETAKLEAFRRKHGDTFSTWVAEGLSAGTVVYLRRRAEGIPSDVFVRTATGVLKSLKEIVCLSCRALQGDTEAIGELAGAGLLAGGTAGLGRTVTRAVGGAVRRLGGKIARIFRRKRSRVSRLPHPPTPGGMPLSEFGKLMKWGTGDADALAQIPKLSRSELVRSGVTKEMAEAWGRFYRNEILRKPTNPSARGRAELMEAAARVLE